MKTKHTIGFTLIEVVIAISIFIVGIVALFPLFSSGMRMLADMDVKTEVVYLARTKMAKIETQGFQDAPANIAKTAFPAPHAEYAYEIQWTPLSYDSASASDVSLYKVELIIYWPGRSGEKVDQFVTYVSRMNPY